jgi:hypothetical protein
MGEGGEGDEQGAQYLAKRLNDVSLERQAPGTEARDD